MIKAIGYVMAAIVLLSVIATTYAVLLIVAGYFIGIGLELAGMK